MILLGGFLTLLKIVDEDPQDLPWWAYALGVAVGGLAVALW